MSPSGKDHETCAAKNNPCRTIQFAIDSVAKSNDVIKIDGSFGNFTITERVKISNPLNITFTSYNGVAQIYGVGVSWRVLEQYQFLVIAYNESSTTAFISVKELNFLDTALARFGERLNNLQMSINLTIVKCRFEFTNRKWESIVEEYPWVTQNIILIFTPFTHLKFENCVIDANHKTGIVRYPVKLGCIHLSSTVIEFKSTRIENARYSVFAWSPKCRNMLTKKGFKLVVSNSVLISNGRQKSRKAQFTVAVGRYHKRMKWIYLRIFNSSFEGLSVRTNTAAVVDIRGPVRATILFCKFRRNVGYRGGALSFETSYITVSYSHFERNKARVSTICAKKGQEGSGGAMFAGGTVLRLLHSSFVNNVAACFGSAVYLGYFKEIKVKQCKFRTRFKNRHTSRTLWYSYSRKMILNEASFNASDDSNVDGTLLFAKSSRFTFNAQTTSFKCPHRSTLNISTSKVTATGEGISRRVRCHYCPKGTYTLTPNEISGFNSTKAMQNKIRSKCHSCSFGAVCQHGIKPKPNFWGYVHKSKALMVVCPPGYCCQTSHQCRSLNSCNSKRTGRLCGKCKYGYFQSFFSNECLEERVCKMWKFWTVFIITCVLFTVFFTFLQDIFLIIVKMVNMDSLVSVIGKRLDWLRRKISFPRKDCCQLQQSSESESRGLDQVNYESNSYRESEEVDASDQVDLIEAQNDTRNRSTAGGLIKIVFFFYQVHSILAVNMPNREFQYIKELKASTLSLFNLYAQIPLKNEFHCPVHGIGSTTKVLIRALFPVSCLMFAVFFFTFVYALSHFFSENDRIRKFSTNVEPRLFRAILQLILLGYSTITSSILSLLTCISLVKRDRILYIDGNVPCYQPWQYAILMFIVLWAIPLIYALHKLPSYMRKGVISVQGVYIALLLPLPFALYSVVRDVRKMTSSEANEVSIAQGVSSANSLVSGNSSNVIVAQLLNVIEGPFRIKTSGEKKEKLSWEPVLLLQRILLSLLHALLLEPSMRSLLLLLFVIIFSYMNAHYRPYGSGFLTAINGITFILLCITGTINAIYALIYEYGIVLKGPLVQLLHIFDYLEIMMIMIFPVIVVGAFVVLAVVRFIVFVASTIGSITSTCKCCESNDG